VSKQRKAAERDLLALSDETKQAAMFIAMTVRNALEDFHVQHLSDAHMRELNPLIRDAIATALHASLHAHDSPAAKAFVEFNARLIPAYGEDPQLLQDFIEVVGLFKAGADDAHDPLPTD